MQGYRIRKRKTSATVAPSTRKIQARLAFKEYAPYRKPSLMRILQTLRANLPELTVRYKIKSLGVFGSYVRDDATPKSDLDMLIEFEENARISLFV